MTPDDIARLADLLDAVLIEATMGAGTPIALNSKGKGSADYETLAKYVSINVGTVAAKLRTLAQQGKAGGVPDRTGTVADISDDELLRRAVFNLARPEGKRRRSFAWSRIMDVFGLGSTYSAQLCRRFERDPDTGKPLAPQPKDAT